MPVTFKLDAASGIRRPVVVAMMIVSDRDPRTCPRQIILKVTCLGSARSEDRDAALHFAEVLEDVMDV